MPAAAEFLREGSQIVIGGGLIPGIRAQGNFRAHCGSADTHGIHTFRVQEIRYEFVVALEIQIADVEENNAVARFNPLAQNFDRLAVPFEKRLEMLGDQRQLYHFTQRTVSQLGNDSRRQAVFRRRFNHQGESGRRLYHFDGRFRRQILRSVDDVSPMNQVRERLGIEVEFFPGDCRDELGAGLVFRVVKHARAGVHAKLFSVGGREKRALVMVEPPGYLRRVGEFEIYDDVFVAIEQAGFPGLRGAVRHSRESEFRVLVKTFAIKAVEESGGSGAIKTAIVKAEPDLGHKCESSPLRLQTVPIEERRSQPRCTDAPGLSRRKACIMELEFLLFPGMLP
jgi:hypothetical protein